MKPRWGKGDGYVWMSGVALAAILVITVLLVGVVLANGCRVFWPARLTQLELHDGTRLLGERVGVQAAGGKRSVRMQLKIGNRDLYGLDFRWVDQSEVRTQAEPAAAIALERQEHGNFYGYLDALALGTAAPQPADWSAFMARWQAARQALGPCRQHQRRVNGINNEIDGIRLRLLRLQYRGVPPTDATVAALRVREQTLKTEFTRVVAQQADMLGRVRQDRAVFHDAAGTAKEVVLADIVRAWRPNDMSLARKCLFYGGKLGELFIGEPRESNTEGGLLPAIVGTITMVFIMSVFSFPLGVITAVYLREYAKDGWTVRLVRIAVNNLAGIPSIVYGIFGLGFFVYGVGGVMDQLFFPERLPTPTFGTGGILWASLTLALLTVPVVIVATEEALGAIPSGLREGSLALGATKLQTLVRILLPMASPGILTGFILAMARAAGEVAPLMITGVVKLAPSLPLDGQFPFVHLERKFMHLGFHIYDIGFQSPNVEAAKPMVFVTTLLLVLIVLVLTGTAIRLRNRMRKRYTLGSF